MAGGHHFFHFYDADWADRCRHCFDQRQYGIGGRGFAMIITKILLYQVAQHRALRWTKQAGNSAVAQLPTDQFLLVSGFENE